MGLLAKSSLQFSAIMKNENELKLSFSIFQILRKMNWPPRVFLYKKDGAACRKIARTPLKSYQNLVLWACPKFISTPIKEVPIQ